MTTGRQAGSLVAGVAAVVATLAMAQAADPTATLVFVRGEVHLTRTGAKTRSAAAGEELRSDDIIRTGNRGRAQLAFPDKTLINLGRDSELQIREYLYEPDRGKGAVVTYVQEGVFRVIGGAIAHLAPERFKTQTPTATIGIRGSDYVGEVTASRTTAGLAAGKGIYATNDKGTVEMDQAGYVTRVRRGEAPGKPSQDPEFIRRIIAATDPDADAPGPRPGGGRAPGGGAIDEPGKRANIDNSIINLQTTVKGDINANQSRVNVGAVTGENSTVKNVVIDSATTVRGRIDADKATAVLGGVKLLNTKVENTDIKSTTNVKGDVKAADSNVNIGGIITDK